MKTVLTLLLALFSVSAAPVSQAGGLKVAASIFPIGDVARNVGGDLVEVHVLLKPGQGPHTYEPTPGDIRKIEESDMIIRVGFGLDHWLRGILGSSAGKERLEVDLSKVVKNPIRSARSPKHGQPGHGDVNPHYWLDPTIMADATRVIAASLSARLPRSSAEISKNADAYVKKLKDLDREIASLLGKAGIGRKFVAFHNAWEYFAIRYGLEQVGVIETAPGRSPSARRFVKLVEEIKKHNVKAVLVEPQFSPKLGEALAREAGARVITVDPMGGVKGRESYIDLMRWNAAQFQKALR